jgi:hypothetical protein
MNQGGKRWITRQAPGGLHVVVDLKEMGVGHVDLSAQPFRGLEHGFGDLDPATASEVVADLIEISEPGA